MYHASSMHKKFKADILIPEKKSVQGGLLETKRNPSSDNWANTLRRYNNYKCIYI